MKKSVSAFAMTSLLLLSAFVATQAQAQQDPPTETIGAEGSSREECVAHLAKTVLNSRLQTLRGSSLSDLEVTGAQEYGVGGGYNFSAHDGNGNSFYGWIHPHMHGPETVTDERTGEKLQRANCWLVVKNYCSPRAEETLMDVKNSANDVIARLTEHETYCADANVVESSLSWLFGSW